VGFLTTKGSTPLAHDLPTSDIVMAQRMTAAGCIVIGRTYTSKLVSTSIASGGHFPCACGYRKSIPLV